MILMTSSNTANKSNIAKSAERAWFAEIFRRFKLIPILLTIAFFLCNILPILISYGQFQTIYMYVKECLAGYGAFNLPLAAASAIIAAVAVFSYLHNTASVTEAHSLPLTRTQLFRASFLAGLIMILIPIAVTAILYLFMQGAHYPDSMSNAVVTSYEFNGNIEALLNPAVIAAWAGRTAIISVFSYCVACFAGILSCTGIIQTLLSIFLLALPNALYAIWYGYMSLFMFGWYQVHDWFQYLSPFAYILDNRFGPKEVPPLLLAYLAFGALLTIASVAVYRRLHLENEDRSIAVNYLAEVLVVILSFMAVSLALIAMVSVIDSENELLVVILTVILATAVAFPVCCMIADRTLKIFNRKNVVTLAAFAAVIIITLAFTVFDAAGYEKKVPAPGDISKVTLRTDTYYGFNNDCYTFTTKEYILKVCNLHKQISEGSHSESDYDYYIPIELTYTLNNGKTVMRDYSFVPNTARDAFTSLYNDKGVRQMDTIDSAILEGKNLDFTVSRESDVDMYEYEVPEHLRAGLISALNSDTLNWTAKGRKLLRNFHDSEAYAMTLSIDNIYVNGERVSRKDIYINENDRHVLDFVKSHPEIFSKKNRRSY